MAWATRYPEARDALRVAHPGFEEVYVGDDARAYGRLVQRLWAEGDGFILVEQDIVVRPDTIASLIRCPFDWCGYPYLETPRSEPVTGLGCTKFGAGIIRAFRRPLEWDPVPVWQNVDVHLAGVLAASGFREHRHAPPVRHLRMEPRPRSGPRPSRRPSRGAGR